jgi:hypothetical protein
VIPFVRVTANSVDVFGNNPNVPTQVTVLGNGEQGLGKIGRGLTAPALFMPCVSENPYNRKLGFRECPVPETEFPRRPLLLVATPVIGVTRVQAPHMLRNLKSRGSQDFLIGLPVVNMRLPGMLRVGVLHVQFSSRPFFYSHQGEQVYDQFPRRLLSSAVRE